MNTAQQKYVVMNHIMMEISSVMWFICVSMYLFLVTASFSCDFLQMYAVHQTLQGKRALEVGNVEATVRVALSIRAHSSRCLTSQGRKWKGWRGEQEKEE
jgi:hypothetical protein